MRTRRRLLIVLVLLSAVVAVPAYLLLGPLVASSRHDASSAGASPVSSMAGPTGAPATPAADPPAASTMPAGELRLEGQALDKDKQPVGGATITLDGSRTITTELDGSFAFDRLPEGEHRLAAEKGTLYAEDTVALSASSEPAVLTLQPGATLVLHVVADGQPVAGAQIMVVQRTAFTDRTGTVRYRGVELGTTYARIVAAQYAPLSTQITMGDDPRAVIEQTIALGHAAAVAGIVVDQDKKPVAGALVSYTMTDHTWSDIVTADEAGHWQIDRLGAGKLAVHASSPKHIATPDLIVPLDGDHPKTDITVQVELGATISVVVVDARARPVDDAQVTCSDGTVASEGQNRFEVTGLTAGTVHLFATTSTQSSAVRTLEIAKTGHLEARLVVVDSTIAGRVKNQHGEPVPGAWVRAHHVGEDGATSEAVTDDQGKFEVHGLPTGDYELVAGRDDDHQETPKPVIVHAGNRRVTLVLPESTMVTGRVVLDGKPVGYFGAKVTDHPGDALPRADVVRSPDGEFAESGLAPGDRSLVIAGPSFARKIIPHVHVAAGRTTDLGDIAVVRGRSISGHVRDERGQPIEGALVTVNDTGLASEDDSLLDQLSCGDQTVSTDATGSYHLDGIPPDAGNLQIGATDTRRAAPPQPLPAGSTVELVLARTGTISGVVVNERNRARIQVYSADGHRYWGNTDESHEFVVPRLPPGAYSVEIAGTVTSAPTYVTVAADATVPVRFEVPVSPINLAVRASAPTGCKEATLRSVASGGIASHDLGWYDCHGSSAAFTDLVPGRYSVCADGHVCEDVEVTPSATRQLVTLRPAPRPR